MEISSIITGLVVAAFIIVPFFLLALAGNKDVKLLEKLFAETAEKEGLDFAVKERINDSCIGLDNNKNKVLIIKVTKGISETKLINLSKIKSMSFESLPSHHKVESLQKSAYFSFLSNEGDAESKVFIYNSVENKPIEFAEIIQKGKRWEELIMKKLNVPVKPKSPNLRRSA